MQRLASYQSCWGYGALAAGADILFAEAMVDLGHELHLVLPFPSAHFASISVDIGQDWRERFQRLYQRAYRVTTIYQERPSNLEDSFALCSEVALGLALNKANMTGAEVQQWAIWDGQPTDGNAGTFADICRARSAAIESLTLHPNRGKQFSRFNRDIRYLPTPLELDWTMTTKQRTEKCVVTSIHGLTELLEQGYERTVTDIYIDMAQDSFGALPEIERPITCRALGKILYHLYAELCPPQCQRYLGYLKHIMKREDNV